MAALLGFSLMACGDDDDDTSSDTTENDSGDSGDSGDVGDDAGGSQKLAEALSASGDFTDEEVGCMIPGMVDAIGTDKLIEAGQSASSDLSGLDLSEEEAGGLFDAMNECVDLRALFTEGMTADSGLTEEQAECVSDGIPDDALKTLIVTSMIEGPDALDANTELVTTIQNATVACMAGG